MKTTGNEQDNNMRTSWKHTAQTVATGIRRRVLEHTLAHNGGYLSQACSSAEIFAALYTKIMNLGPAEALAVSYTHLTLPTKRIV